MKRTIHVLDSEVPMNFHGQAVRANCGKQVPSAYPVHVWDEQIIGAGRPSFPPNTCKACVVVSDATHRGYVSCFLNGNEVPEWKKEQGE